MHFLALCGSGMTLICEPLALQSSCKKVNVVISKQNVMLMHKIRKKEKSSYLYFHPSVALFLGPRAKGLKPWFSDKMPVRLNVWGA